MIDLYNAQVIRFLLQRRFNYGKRLRQRVH
jgi:hypothetical protein